MRILFYRYNSICEPDMVEAFRSFGITVVEECTEIKYKSLSNTDRIELLRSHLEKSGETSKEPFLFVFSFNFFPVISELCNIYQIPYVCWSVDSPLAEIYTRQVTNNCNRLFLFDRYQYDSLKSFNPSGIFHLPLCTNTARWDQVISDISDDDLRKYACDISFIGSLYTEKDPWLDLLSAQDSQSDASDTKSDMIPKVSLSQHTIGVADGLVAAQLSLTGCNILEDAIDPETAREIVAAFTKDYPSDKECVMEMDRYIAAQHILGMHASSLYRIRVLQMLAERFPVDLYTRSTLPEALQNLERQCAPVVNDGSDISTVSLSSESDKQPTGRLNLRGGAKTLTEMPKIFHLSKINLNMTIYPIRSGLSLRIWDVLGCGGFLLTNVQPELEEHFVPGKDLDVFSCPEELLDKCEYYLTHEDVRSQIALNGYRKVKESHTYRDRFAQMLRFIS